MQSASRPMISHLESYLKSKESDSVFLTSVEHVKSQKILTLSSHKQQGHTSAFVGPSVDVKTVIWFTIRRVDQNTNINALLYIVLKEVTALYKVCS